MRRSTPVTLALLVVIAAVFVLETVSGGSTRTDVLVALGANVAPLVLAGQWWRLLTSIFLHIGLAHVALNGYALYQLGGLFEHLAGSRRMLGVFVASGLAGSLASVVFTRGISAGASGAIFGLLGALIGLLLKRHDRLRPEAKSLLTQLGFWAAINIFFGLTVPGIDNAAHLGGCAAGLLFGLNLRLRSDW